MNNKPWFDKMMELTGLPEPVIKSIVLDDEKTNSRCNCLFKLYSKHGKLLRQDIFLNAILKPFPDNKIESSIKELINENKMPATALDSLLKLRLDQEVENYRQALDNDPIHQAIMASIKNNTY